MEYSLGRVNGSGGGCASAEFVRVLPRGSVHVAKPLEPTLNGSVTRTLRALNPDQAKYSGNTTKGHTTKKCPFFTARMWLVRFVVVNRELYAVL